MTTKTSKSKNGFNLYQSVTSQIIELIETSQASGRELPWHRAGADVFLPVNATTGSRYQGINVVSLWASAEINRFTTGTWSTYKQWQSIGAQVRKGESSTLGVFYKKYVPNRKSESAAADKQNGRFGDRGDENSGSDDSGDVDPGEEPRPRWFARTFRVFNADQVDGYEPDEHSEELPEESLVERIERVEAFVETTGATVGHGGGRAYYNPSGDYIQMPGELRFRDTETSTATEGYYATLFHELTHWSGHKRRCDRDLTGRFGDASYAMEELVAELGAAFLCAELGISAQPREDHAGYIAHWLEVMREDAAAIFTAAAKASEAARYLRGSADEERAVDASSK
ncbi:antirestriction protein ArdC [Salinibacter ruber]|uniref:ArdC family protein n=1 Tax=Salinibacter ruber TaxID=146919 RepID=UPI002167574B|nr:zincin-like metallopeptidase domain-containing protein [Salinibacter ruber]MCS3751379.1 antirestriction protein ArdC [Salinibacter ruber]